MVQVSNIRFLVKLLTLVDECCVLEYLSLPLKSPLYLKHSKYRQALFCQKYLPGI